MSDEPFTPDELALYYRLTKEHTFLEGMTPEFLRSLVAFVERKWLAQNIHKIMPTDTPFLRSMPVDTD